MQFSLGWSQQESEDYEPIADTRDYTKHQKSKKWLENEHVDVYEDKGHINKKSSEGF